MDTTKKSLPENVVIKILMTYYGAACKFRKRGTQDPWRWTSVDFRAIQHYKEIETVLSLKPLYMLEMKHVKRITHLLHDPSHEQNHDESLLTEEGVKQFREHLQDSITVAPYIVVDYLRRENFHVPLFGVDLYKAGIAQVWNVASDKKSPVDKKNTGLPWTSSFYQETIRK